MFSNFLKTAWRNLIKNKAFSVINILGLAIGLSCFLLISMYVLDELSFDKFHAKSNRIYRINSDIRFGGSDMRLPVSSDIIGATLKKDYPEVEEFTRIYASGGPKLIKKGNEFINDPAVAHADSTIFKVFTLPAIAGDVNTALNEPNTVVITETAAKKYFNTKDAVGKTIETNDNTSTVYKVTAVIKDIPENSHFNFDLLFSMDNVDYNWNSHLSHNFHTYLLLKPGADYRALEAKFPQYIQKYVLPQAAQIMEIQSMEDFEKAGNKLQYGLMPLEKIHLYSGRQFELSPGGNIQYVYIFSAVALFILLIACINFMNLATARSANRAREVGIRKVLGTEKRQLIAQFLSESTLTALLALAIAVFIAAMVLPLFNDMASKSLTIATIFEWKFLPILIVLPLVVGLVAGSYPAFFLSAFKPIEVLKGKLKLGSKSGGLRSVLVVLQFSISIALMISTIVVFRQLNYIQTKNLGFNKDQVLIVNDAYTLRNNADAFKNEVLQIPGVKSGTFSGFLPVSNSYRNDNSYFTTPVPDTKSGFNMQAWRIDHDYFKTLGLEMAKGRSFSREFGTDSTAVVINETAAKIMGHADPIGKKLYGFNDSMQVVSYDIIGVVKNFHFETLRQDIGPLSFFLRRSTGLASFKVEARNIPSVLKQVEAKWKAMAPGMPFNHRFLDESFDEMYRVEQRVSNIALTFAILAIIVACLGLFGLASFIAEQRTKEIGIRKVLGLSMEGILKLLSKDFLKLVLIAFIIASPLAWYFMHAWLQDFAYRVNIAWWVFALAGFLALSIAMLTVSFQAVKAALMNPVKSLRTE
ncbi:MAG TPA: ABC transporter permease [Chitinophagaceae bacterium]|nr:ABC transporter permease [Chitinophagaceae bacterium]